MSGNKTTLPTDIDLGSINWKHWIVYIIVQWKLFIHVRKYIVYFPFSIFYKLYIVKVTFSSSNFFFKSWKYWITIFYILFCWHENFQSLKIHDETKKYRIESGPNWDKIFIFNFKNDVISLSAFKHVWLIRKQEIEGILSFDISILFFSSLIVKNDWSRSYINIQCAVRFLYPLKAFQINTWLFSKEFV